MVDSFQITGLYGCPLTLKQISAEHAFDEGRPGMVRSSEAIDSGQDFTRKCDRCLHFHTTNIPPRKNSREDVGSGRETLGRRVLPRGGPGGSPEWFSRLVIETGSGALVGI